VLGHAVASIVVVVVRGVVQVLLHELHSPEVVAEGRVEDEHKGLVLDGSGFPLDLVHDDGEAVHLVVVVVVQWFLLWMTVFGMVVLLSAVGDRLQAGVGGHAGDLVAVGCCWGFPKNLGGRVVVVTFMERSSAAAAAGSGVAFVQGKLRVDGGCVDFLLAVPFHVAKIVLVLILIIIIEVSLGKIAVVGMGGNIAALVAFMRMLMGKGLDRWKRGGRFHGKGLCRVGFFRLFLVDHERRVEELVGLGVISLGQDQNTSSVVQIKHTAILLSVLLELQVESAVVAKHQRAFVL